MIISTNHKSKLTLRPKISLIAAVSKDQRALGFKNKLLWKIDGDLPRFKTITAGHPIIMGRLTYESIGRPLPNRTNIVISKSGSLQETSGLIITSSVEDAISIAKKIDQEEIFIIGGGKIYSETLKYANRLYLTIVDDEPEADTFFPDYSGFKTIIEKEEHHEHNPPFTYIVLEK